MCQVCTPFGGNSRGIPGRRGPTRRALLAFSPFALIPSCDGGLPINLVSEQTVENLSLQSWQRMRASMPPSRDAGRQEAVRKVSDRLLTAAGEPAADWEVVLFASPDVNAFALPGRRIGVFEGMFRVAANHDQLAAVIGHEIGHVQAHHSHDRMNVAVAKDIGLKALAVALQLGNVQHANAIAGALGLGVEYGLLLPYSRTQELEADRLGLVNMAHARFDPREAVELWRRMDRMVASAGPTFLATHPNPADRIAGLEKQIEALPRFQ